MNLVRIPKRFYDDSVIDCPVGDVIKSTKQHYYIDADDKEGLSELISRAYDYATDLGTLDSFYRPIIQSADATLNALKKQGIDIQSYRG